MTDGDAFVAVVGIWAAGAVLMAVPFVIRDAWGREDDGTVVLMLTVGWPMAVPLALTLGPVWLVLMGLHRATAAIRRRVRPEPDAHALAAESEVNAIVGGAA